MRTLGRDDRLAKPFFLQVASVFTGHGGLHTSSFLQCRASSIMTAPGDREIRKP